MNTSYNLLMVMIMVVICVSCVLVWFNVVQFFHEGCEYYTCEECNSIFTRPNDFISHLNDVHVHTV